MRDTKIDRVIEVFRAGLTRKVKTGVCGSKHILSSGFVYSPKGEGRRKVWAGLEAYDQMNWYAGDESNYDAEYAAAHASRMEIYRDGNLISTLDIRGETDGRGVQFFDLNEAGHYSIVLSNLETGECSGGKCEDGTTYYYDALHINEQEVSNCWYRYYVNNFTISQEEIDRVKDTEDIPPGILLALLQGKDNGVGGGNGEGEILTTEEMFLFGGLSLAGLLFFVGVLKTT
jgi:hypothetical protein